MTTGFGGSLSSLEGTNVGTSPSNDERSGLASLGDSLAILLPPFLALYLDKSILKGPEMEGVGRCDLGGDGSIEVGAGGGGESD